MQFTNFLNALAIFGSQYLYMLLLAIALIWYLKQPRAAQIEMIAWGVAALPLMYLLLLIAGMVYYDPRPFVSDGIVPLIMHDPDNGFPSDHTLLCSATAAIVFCYNKKFSGFLWLLTAIVGACRVYTGIHHVLDIVTSMIIAISISPLSWKFLVPIIKRNRLYSISN